MELDTAISYMEEWATFHAGDNEFNRAWKTIRAQLMETAPSASTNNARDKICPMCKDGWVIFSAGVCGRILPCEVCGGSGKLSPVA